MYYWWCPNCKRELDGVNVTYEENCDICGARVLAIKEGISQEEIEIAIEKQTLKKPSIEEEMGYFICPSCDMAIGYANTKEEHNYCFNCGQKLDWD